MTLPPIPEADRIVITAHELAGEVPITDPGSIRFIRSFVNGQPEGWGVPWYGPPVAAVRLQFYAGNAFVGDFGLSEDFITRTHGDFYSKNMDEKALREWAMATHPAIFEAAFTIIPDNVDTGLAMERAKTALSGLKTGTEAAALYAHIAGVGWTITADYPAFINVSLATLHEGGYADTVIAGQLELDGERRLKGARFFGIVIRKKARD